MNNLTEIKSMVDAYIEAQPFSDSPCELYDPLNYIMGLGGKRLRPVTLLLAHQMFSPDLEKALPAGYAIELFHNFSLIHDDIMDEAPLRRGHTTVHQKWDSNTAILSGDAMLIHSYRYLNLACSGDNAQDIFRLYSGTAIKVCEGQQMDVNFETQHTVKQEEYITMIYNKTGALIEGAMQIGATLGGAKKTDIDHIGQFAKQLGISFQLQDDILDAFGDKAAVGKQIGGDIIQNKKTILYLLALKSGSEQQKNDLANMFTDSSIEDQTKVNATMEIFHDLDIRGQAEQLRDAYHKDAFAALDCIDCAVEAKNPLIQFADYLLERKF